MVIFCSSLNPSRSILVLFDMQACEERQQEQLHSKKRQKSEVVNDAAVGRMAISRRKTTDTRADSLLGRVAEFAGRTVSPT